MVSVYMYVCVLVHVGLDMKVCIHACMCVFVEARD